MTKKKKTYDRTKAMKKSIGKKAANKAKLNVFTKRDQNAKD